MARRKSSWIVQLPKGQASGRTRETETLTTPAALMLVDKNTMPHGLVTRGASLHGPIERQPPGLNMIGYTTVTIPPSGCGKDRP